MILLKHVCISKYFTEPIFVEFRDFMGFYLSQKAKFLIPIIPFLASSGRPGQSTESGVGRPSRLTDVHKRACLVWLEGRSTDPVDRQRALLSGKPQSIGSVDRQRALLSVPGHGRPGRSTAGSTVRNLTVSRSTGPVDR